MAVLSSLRHSELAQVCIASPLLSAFSAFLLICIITRILTGVRSSLALANRDADNKTPNRISYWLPWVGSFFSFVGDLEATIARDR
jgi:hypothetical protein